MRISLADMLATHDVILADGATATNFFQRGLESGYPPELWNVEHPHQLTRLHQEFVDAGADLILTNSFGGTRQRLKLHKADDRVFELAEAAAKIARAVADDPDAAPLDFDWSKAKIYFPIGKIPISLRVDPDVLAFFKSDGKGFQTRINAVLRAYMEHELARAREEVSYSG